MRYVNPRGTALLLRTGCFLAALLGIGFAASPSGAQEPDSGPSVHDVYDKTKTAKTVEDFSRILQDCRTLRQTDLSDANAEYLVRLTSYVLNSRGEVYASQATELQEKGDTEASSEIDGLALADFEESVKRNPQYHKALHNRGVSYAVRGEYEKAIADFSRTIEIKADYPNAWFNRAEIRYELGRYEEALSDYSRVITLNRSDAGAFTSRGHTYFQLGRYDRALEDYDRAVRMAPDNAVAYADRGDAHRSLGRWRQANSDYRDAIRRDGKSSRIYQSAAWLLATCPDARYRNAETGLQAAQRAIRLGNDQDFRLLDTLAAAHANAGQFDKARETVQRAIQLAPEDEVEVLQRRLKLYQGDRPYRQGSASAPNG